MLGIQAWQILIAVANYRNSYFRSYFATGGELILQLFAPPFAKRAQHDRLRKPGWVQRARSRNKVSLVREAKGYCAV
jgi:hypothetical protein